MLWQAIDSHLFGFGGLVLVITFATAAILDSINSSNQKDKVS
jgi:hypothetical protein